MTDLGDRMEKIFRASAGAGQAPPSLVEQARGLRDHFGSGRKAAKALGVNESTFRRIISGKTQHPKVSTMDTVRSIFRDVSVRRIRLDDIRIPVTPMGHGQRTGRDRELAAKNLKITDPGAADRIRAAYVAGGKEAAAVAFLKEVKDPHYKSWLTPDQHLAQVYDDGSDVERGYEYAVS